MEESIERKRPQFRIKSREQPRDKRKPASAEVTDIKRMPKKEKGHTQLGFGSQIKEDKYRKMSTHLGNLERTVLMEF